MDELRQAVRNRTPVSISYDPVRPGVRGTRIIEPHAVGFSRKKGIPIVRAWVRSGESFSEGRFPHAEDGRTRWRLFRVDNIRTMRVFHRQRFPLRPGFRRRADSSMRVAGRVLAH
jgi:hypothetical protein